MEQSWLQRSSTFSKFVQHSQLCFSTSLIGIPGGIDAEIQVLRSSEGAALIVLDNNIREGIERNIQELEDWGRDNAKTILRLEKKTRKHGFFIVTAVRRTKRFQLKCWESTTSGFSEKLKGRIPGGGTAGIEGVDLEMNVLNGWISPPKQVHPPNKRANSKAK